MPPTETLIAFAAATAVFAYMPGPAMLYAAAQTFARGRRAGLMAALGIHLGCYVHVLATAFGLSALLALVPLAFTVVKVLGAAYLVWLGLKMILQKAEGGAAGTAAPKSARRAFVESVLVEVLNPKAALFFLAFLPQFVDAGAGLPVWQQLLILGTIVNFAFSSADIVVILTASAVMRRLGRNGWGERLARIAGGSLLVALGVKLATDKG